MPVCGNYLFFELPKKIVLNPKDGITLRGKVLPVGGIKEKVLAAHRAGIRTILLPRENEADIDDIPQSVRRQLTFHLLDRAKEALDWAMLKKED